MDINMVVKRYASGEVSRDELNQIYKGIGYSQEMVNILLRAADYKKECVEHDEANNIDSSRFQIPFDDCLSPHHSPSGSLEDEETKGR